MKAPKSNCLSCPSVSRPCSSVFLACLWAVGLVHSVSAAPIPGFDWWFSASTDADWTNKPLSEIHRAAEAGEPPAQYYLGRAWFFGLFGKRDMDESFTWVRRSAEQAYPQAELLLARFYFLGLPVDRNQAEGFRWATRAAEHGNADAMSVLGLSHEFGEGAPRDARSALEWFQRAEKAGSRVAPKWMGDFYSRGEARTARRTNHVEALRCYERAASNDLISAGAMVADMYWKGRGTVPDFDRTLYWLRRLTDKGAPDMMEKLAAAYAEGPAEPRNAHETPTELIRRAAEIHGRRFEAGGDASWAFNPSLDFIHDCQELWNRYRFGIGTSRDFVASARWMWQAYREDLRRDANGKGSFTGAERVPHPFDPYLKSDSTPLTTEQRLWQQAVRIVYEALDENRPEACHQIGENYRNGSKLTPKNPVQAWAWFNRAANLGYAPGKIALESLQKDLTPSQLQAAQDLWLPRPIEKPR